MNCDLEHFEVQICSFVTTSDTQIGKNELTFDYRLLTSTETSLYATHEQYDSDGGKGDDVTLFLFWSPYVLLSSKGKVSRGGGGAAAAAGVRFPGSSCRRRLPTSSRWQAVISRVALRCAVSQWTAPNVSAVVSYEIILRLLQSTSGKLMTLI